MLIQKTAQYNFTHSVKKQAAAEKTAKAANTQVSRSLMSYPAEYYVSFGSSSEEEIRRLYENLPDGRIISQTSAARNLGISKDTITQAKKKNPELADTIASHSIQQSAGGHFKAVSSIPLEICDEIIDMYTAGESLSTISMLTEISIKDIKNLLYMNKDYLEYKTASPNGMKAYSICGGMEVSEKSKEFPDISADEIIENGYSIAGTGGSDENDRIFLSAY